MNKSTLLFLLTFLLCNFSSFAQSENQQMEEKPNTNESKIETPAISVPDTTQREVFEKVEERPLFPGCEDVIDPQKKKECADLKMLQFLYGNLRYPAVARANGIEGMVVIEYIIEPDGSLSNLEVAQDIGGGCGEAAMKVVKSMPNWIPGKQEGKAVAVSFKLPVRFKLERSANRR